VETILSRLVERRLIEAVEGGYSVHRPALPPSP